MSGFYPSRTLTDGSRCRYAKAVAAIDPGPKQSGVAWVGDQGEFLHGEIMPNEYVFFSVQKQILLLGGTKFTVEELLVEHTQPYTLTTKSGGSFFPKQILQTAVWVGRFWQSWYDFYGTDPKIISRRDVKKILLGHGGSAQDKHVMENIIKRYGGETRQQVVGTQKNPGPLYGVKGDIWAALAVALAWLKTEGVKNGFSRVAGGAYATILGG